MPNSPVDPLMRQALAHHQAGRVAEAEKLYRQIIATDPNQAAALHLLGVIAHQANRSAEAVDLLGRSLRLQPAVPRAWYNYAEALRATKRYEEALAAYRTGFAQDRPLAADISNFGIVLCEAGRMAEAIAQFRRAIAADDRFPEAWNNLANALQETGDYSGALEAYHRSIALRPTLADSINNMGVCLEKLDRLDESEAASRRALALNPKLATGYINLAYVLRRLGRFEEALQTNRKGLELLPTSPEGQWNAACLELTFGNWAVGLPAYESRYRISHVSPDRNLPGPRWDGSDLNGRTILVHEEQGFGDMIMAARFAPLVAARGGKVILQVLPALVDLMKSVEGVEQVVSAADALPAYDVHAPLMSLMLLLKMTRQTIPTKVPYLQPDAARVGQWGDRLQKALALSGAPDRALRVGLVWQGRVKPDRLRAISPELLAPLAAVPGVVMVSLQKPELPPEPPPRPAPFPIIDLTEQINDFADSAALLTHLDLLITIDTATAHLAGAMGREVWTFIPFVPDWRWELAGDRTLWYPTMRLFRQSIRNDWPGPISRVRDELFRRPGQGGKV
jgi:tetratricopeptide (TPR) repeat protein